MENNSNPLKKVLSVRGMRQVLTAAAGLIIICFVFGLQSPAFFKPQNIGNLTRQIAPILLIGVGQSFVLITGNIDLSIGSVVGMSSMVAATLMTKGGNPWLCALAALAVSLIVGSINGILVSYAGLPPFIATLGTMSISRGIAQLVNNNYNTDSIGEAAGAFRDFMYYGKTLGIYNTVIIALLLWAVFFFVLMKTRTGRHIYAIGSNVDAARLSGVSVVSTTVKAYIVSSFCASVVGLIVCASAGMGAMDAGTSYEMYAVAAAVIGGISTLGGQGNLIGTVVGASIWAVLQNGLSLVGAKLAFQNITIGVIVIVAVLLDVIVRKRGK